MPTKSEFKFNCPTCGQHILASAEWCGRKINCPSCQTSITIPEPPKETKKPAPVMPPSPATHPNYSSKPIRVDLPANDSAPASRPKPVTSADKPAPSASTPAQPQQLRIAALTPALKLDMVRSVRRRLSSESAWLPGKVGGKYAYAAKVVNGEPVPADVNEPQATRFSLLGAFLVELRQRQVVRTATGRTRLLDEEIPDAVRDVLMEDMNEEARAEKGASTTNEDWMCATHAQCLAALEALEETYSHRMEQARIEKAKRRIANVRLPDLVKKFEKKARIESADVAAALYHELMEVQRRLDRLENKIAPTDKPPSGKVP